MTTPFEFHPDFLEALRKRNQERKWSWDTGHVPGSWGTWGEAEAHEAQAEAARQAFNDAQKQAKPMLIIPQADLDRCLQRAWLHEGEPAFIVGEMITVEIKIHRVADAKILTRALSIPSQPSPPQTRVSKRARRKRKGGSS